MTSFHKCVMLRLIVKGTKLAVGVFIEKACNNSSFVLSAAEEFATRLKTLPRYARDQHEWDGGQCDFHPLRVCSVKIEGNLSVKVDHHSTYYGASMANVLEVLLELEVGGT